jgi:crossover junction endodeoxyribonuclease RuvC
MSGTSHKETLRVLGFDPGTAILGWAFVEVGADGNPVKPQTEFGVIRTKAGLHDADRLVILWEELEKMMRKYKPDVVGVEQLFFNRNVTTAITVAQARGVVLTSGRLHGAEIVELTPPQVKESITGYGKADKHQMQKMIKLLLGLKETPKPDDAADALAVALTSAQVYAVEKRLARAN